MWKSRVGVGAVLTVKYNKWEFHILLQAVEGCGMSFGEALKFSAVSDCANFTSILNILKPAKLKQMQIERDSEVPSPNYVC